jgi:hypothetical protein
LLKNSDCTLCSPQRLAAIDFGAHGAAKAAPLQNKIKIRVFPQPAKGVSQFEELYGIAEAMPGYEP